MPIIKDREIDSYRKNGFLLRTGLLSPGEIDRFASAVYREFENHRYRPTSTRYPQANKYVLYERNLVEPDVNFIVDHPRILEPVESLLGASARLSTFSVHMKTPGWTGTIGDYQGTHHNAHCDYKTYRPVGSSLNWLFVIIALVDYTDDIGPLLVSPGSHLYSRKSNRSGRVSEIRRARGDEIPPFVDTQLRKGDVLFMHMFTWHQAYPNRSERNRCGVYNKYMADDAPPGCGPYLFPESTYEIFKKRGSDLIAHHSDHRLATSRLLLEHGKRILFLRQSGGQWTLPGGPAQLSPRAQGSNGDNVIQQLSEHVKIQLGIDLSWASYAGDYPEEGELCRVYGYPMKERPNLTTNGSREMSWLCEREVAEFAREGRLSFGFESEAVRSWIHDRQLRGRGQSAAKAKYSSTKVRAKEKSQSPLLSDS